MLQHSCITKRLPKHCRSHDAHASIPYCHRLHAPSSARLCPCTSSRCVSLMTAAASLLLCKGRTRILRHCCRQHHASSILQGANVLVASLHYHKHTVHGTPNRSMLHGPTHPIDLPLHASGSSGGLSRSSMVWSSSRPMARPLPRASGVARPAPAAAVISSREAAEQTAEKELEGHVELRAERCREPCCGPSKSQGRGALAT